MPIHRIKTQKYEKNNFGEIYYHLGLQYVKNGNKESRKTDTPTKYGIIHWCRKTISSYQTIVLYTYKCDGQPFTNLSYYAVNLIDTAGVPFINDTQYLRQKCQNNW